METFHNACLGSMLGPHQGPDGPSTAELLATTGQTSMADLLRWHRVMWLGHASHKPNDVMVKKLLFAHSIPGMNGQMRLALRQERNLHMQGLGERAGKLVHTRT